MKKISDPRTSFIFTLQGLYDVEKQLEKALPKLAKASTSEDLKEGFLEHLKETKIHTARLEEIFTMLDSVPKKRTCAGIRAIIEEANEIITSSNAPAELKDSMIAAAARYAEHYEMAGYKGALIEAAQLEMNNAVDLMLQTLAEEEGADAALEAAMEKCLTESVMDKAVV